MILITHAKRLTNFLTVIKTPATGRVLCGINNIYTVLIDDRIVSCRIKGKVLRGESGENVYNPIAVGDSVSVLFDDNFPDVGWIDARMERESRIVRFNKKRRAVQIIAANADLLICVASIRHPPFRPRFTDRMLISTQAGNVVPVIFINKCDLGISRQAMLRIEIYKKIGYRLIMGSALTGAGLPELKKLLSGKTSVFAGQSGVGKSFLLNRLYPGLDLKIGDISRKYNRGEHTTNFAVMIKREDSWVVDTPGIRELEIYGVPSQELAHYFPEFSEPSEECTFSTCLHLDEPDCGVKEALRRGMIHPDRYESYTRIYRHLEAYEGQAHG